jgi:uncharacterized LabA/DUF88 family protein
MLNVEQRSGPMEQQTDKDYTRSIRLDGAWVIDGAYLLKAAPGIFDYMKLKSELERRAGGPFRESYFLNTVSTYGDAAQDRFHEWLQHMPPTGPGMQVRLYTTKQMHGTCEHCGQSYARDVQKGVDVGLATLLLRLAPNYDRLVLSAGDGDLADAIQGIVADYNTEVVVAGFRGSVSRGLLEAGAKALFIDEFWSSVERPDVQHYRGF